MAIIRPNLVLILDIDEKFATKATKDEIKRNYTHIGSPIIRSHEHEEEPQNNATLMVDFGVRDYLHSDVENADQLWDDVVEQWIGNMLHKVGNNMKVFNDRQRKIRMPELIFDRMDIVLGDDELTIGLHTDPLSFIEKHLKTQVSTVRKLYNDGTFKDVVRVNIPSTASYDEQRDAAWETWSAEHPEPEEPEEPEEPIEEPVNNHGVVPDYDDEAYEAWLEADKEAKSYENTAVPPTDSDALPRPERPEEPEEPEQFDFDVDYTLWQVFYADGTNRIYDSSTGAFA